ncbi:MAG: hypothetical protein ACETWM_17460 [Candidatus Lokiarchaeia archaeon]
MGRILAELVFALLRFALGNLRAVFALSIGACFGLMVGCYLFSLGLRFWWLIPGCMGACALAIAPPVVAFLNKLSPPRL